MANEQPNPIELHGDNKGGVMRYSCVDGIAIAKGALLLMDEATGKIRTISGSSAAHVNGAYAVAGIASSEKVADDGQLTIGVWTKGIFDLKLNTDTCAVGDALTISGANMVGPVYPDTTVLTQNVLGVALESGTTGATVSVKVDC